MSDLPAGRELDALIAEKVMGYKWRRFPFSPKGMPLKCLCHPDDTVGWHDLQGDETRAADADRWVRHYSTYITDAWEVVEKMMKRTTFGLDWLGHDGEEWRCIFAWTTTEHNPAKCWATEAATAPHAICLAALVALRASEGKENKG